MKKLVTFLVFMVLAVPAFAQTEGGAGMDGIHRIPDNEREAFIEQIKQEKNIYEVREAQTTPSYISNRKVILTPQEQEALRLAKDFERKAVKPIMSKGGKVTFVYGASVPTLLCVPFKISDLELQQGEIVNSVILGDSARWHSDILQVGGGGVNTPHVVFKPVDSGLETSAVITTNRRVYHVNLKSQRAKFMPYAGFIYMNEARQHLASAQAKIEAKQAHYTTPQGQDISNLDFAYQIKGKARWKPIQVFNDGVKTYIKMPDNINQGEMPVLLVENKTGQALVNYRVRNNSFVVDQLFEEAVLIVGVGSNQEKITIKWDRG